MFKQLFQDLMSVWVTRWFIIYPTVAFIATKLIDWLFQSPVVDIAINGFYIIFVIAFAISAFKEHIRESREEEELKARSRKHLKKSGAEEVGNN
ncbi:MAG: hypothetical protein R3F02_11720 [Thiolinea sp.]